MLQLLLLLGMQSWYLAAVRSWGLPTCPSAHVAGLRGRDGKALQKWAFFMMLYVNLPLLLCKQKKAGWEFFSGG